LLDAPADLRGGDLCAVLGVQLRVSLAEQAGSEESRNGSTKTSATGAICRDLTLDSRQERSRPRIILFSSSAVAGERPPWPVAAWPV
jgi:hypothetical protein